MVAVATCPSAFATPGQATPGPISYRAIAKLLGVPASTANNIFHHAVSNATAKREREEAAQPARDEEEEATQPARDEEDQSLLEIDSADC